MFSQVSVCPRGGGREGVHPLAGRHPLAGTHTPGRHPLAGRQPPPQQTATAADGTHPTGMHSCFQIDQWWIYNSRRSDHGVFFLKCWSKIGLALPSGVSWIFRCSRIMEWISEIFGVTLHWPTGELIPGFSVGRHVQFLPIFRLHPEKRQRLVRREMCAVGGSLLNLLIGKCDGEHFWAGEGRAKF